MHGDIEWAETLFNDFRNVQLIQIGESDEIAKHEGKAKVIIFDMQRVADAGAHLVHKAEDAVVDAGAAAMLHRFDAQRGFPVLSDVEGVSFSIPQKLDGKFFVCAVKLQIEKIGDGVAIDADDFIIGLQTGGSGQTVGMDGFNGNGHLITQLLQSL